MTSQMMIAARESKMKIRKLLIDFVITFAIALVVSEIVTFLYNLLVHGAGTVDSETSFRFAIILGIALPWIHAQRDREKMSDIFRGGEVGQELVC